MRTHVFVVENRCGAFRFVFVSGCNICDFPSLNLRVQEHMQTSVAFTVITVHDYVDYGKLN